MQEKPNRVQMAVELAYDLTKNNITGDNLDGKMRPALVPVPRDALLLHLVLEHDRLHPAADQHRAHGRHLRRSRSRRFAIYAATANISIPLVLTLVVWVTYHVEGIRAKGFFTYFESWLPAGLEDMNPIGKARDLRDRGDLPLRPPDLALGATLRQHPRRATCCCCSWAAGWRCCSGWPRSGALTFPLAFVFFIFEVGLVATLQAFIFSTLTAIYIGGAIAESH